MMTRISSDDLLCTEGLLRSGVVDLFWGNGWRHPTLRTLQLAQHGLLLDEPTEPLPSRAVLGCYSVHFADAMKAAEKERPFGMFIFVVRDGDASLCEDPHPNCSVHDWPNCVDHVYGSSVLRESQRLTAMPMGFHAVEANTTHLQPLLDKPRRRDNTTLVAFSLDTGSVFTPDHERQKAVAYFRDKSWATLNPGLLSWKPGSLFHASSETGWTLPEYLDRLLGHDYLIDPIGYGVERISRWEAMALGTIPICHPHAELLHFADMPIAFVDDWSEVTPAWCDRNLAIRDRPLDKLRLSYWVERIAADKKALLS